MKPQHLAWLATLATPALTLAQGNTTLYGIADAGVRHTAGMTAANAPSAASATSLASGVNNTSRFGLRGREELGVVSTRSSTLKPV